MGCKESDTTEQLSFILTLFSVNEEKQRSPDINSRRKENFSSHYSEKFRCLQALACRIGCNIKSIIVLLLERNEAVVQEVSIFTEMHLVLGVDHDGIGNILIIRETIRKKEKIYIVRK